MTTDPAYASAVGADLYEDTGESGLFAPGQHIIVITLADHKGDTFRASLSIDDARYLVGEMTRALEEHDA